MVGYLDCHVAELSISYQKRTNYLKTSFEDFYHIHAQGVFGNNLIIMVLILDGNSLSSAHGRSYGTIVRKEFVLLNPSFD